MIPHLVLAKLSITVVALFAHLLPQIKLNSLRQKSKIHLSLTHNRGPVDVNCN